MVDISASVFVRYGSWCRGVSVLRNIILFLHSKRLLQRERSSQCLLSKIRSEVSKLPKDRLHKHFWRYDQPTFYKVRTPIAVSISLRLWQPERIIERAAPLPDSTRIHVDGCLQFFFFFLEIVTHYIFGEVNPSKMDVGRIEFDKSNESNSRMWKHKKELVLIPSGARWNITTKNPFHYGTTVCGRWTQKEIFLCSLRAIPVRQYLRTNQRDQFEEGSVWHSLKHISKELSSKEDDCRTRLLHWQY